MENESLLKELNLVKDDLERAKNRLDLLVNTPGWADNLSADFEKTIHNLGTLVATLKLFLAVKKKRPQTPD